MKNAGVTEERPRVKVKDAEEQETSLKVKVKTGEHQTAVTMKKNIQDSIRKLIVSRQGPSRCCKPELTCLGGGTRGQDLDDEVWLSDLAFRQFLLLLGTGNYNVDSLGPFRVRQCSTCFYRQSSHFYWLE